MTQLQKNKLIEYLDSYEFKKLEREASKADKQPMAISKGVTDLCQKYALIEPKAKMISMLFAMVFPKSKLDFNGLLDGLTAFCSVQK